MQSRDRLGRFRSDLVLDRDAAQQPVALEHGEHGHALTCPA
jgi:hypothetical protein